jgi:S1-C subfamily serine protease
MANIAHAQQQPTPPPPQPERPIVFGMQFGDSANGQTVVANVYPNSPAADAGLKPGDVIVEVGSRQVQNSSQLTKELAGRKTGERIAFRVLRNGRPQTTELVADATLPVLGNAPGGVSLDERVFGWTLRDGPQGAVTVAKVADGSAAAKLGLQAGDVITSVADTRVQTARQLSDLTAKLMAQRPGEEVPLTILRGNDEMAVKLTMPQNRAAAPAGPVPAPLVPAPRDNAGRLFGMVLKTSDAGVVVTDVIDGSPAARAGILPGDTIVNIGKTEVSTFGGLLRTFDLLKPAPEVKVTLARDGEPMTATLVIGPPRTAPPEERVAALQEQASHIVVGGVKAIYSYEQQTPDWQLSHRVAEIAVAEVEKGEGLEPGQLMYVRYSVSKPAAGAAEPNYPNVRSTFRLFVKRMADGGYDLLMPGGAQVIDSDQPVAANTPQPRTVLRPVTPPPGAVPVPPAAVPAPTPARTPGEVPPRSPTAPAAAATPSTGGNVPVQGIEGTVVLGESPQAGMQVDLWDAAGLVDTTTTNAQGAYAFNVPPGRYQISARGRIGNLIRVAPPITVFVPVNAQQRTTVRVPLP